MTMTETTMARFKVWPVVCLALIGTAVIFRGLDSEIGFALRYWIGDELAWVAEYWMLAAVGGLIFAVADAAEKRLLSNR